MLVRCHQWNILNEHGAIVQRTGGGSLKPGEAKTVNIHLSRLELSYWSTPAQAWIVATGPRNVYVGASSDDIRFQGKVSVVSPASSCSNSCSFGSLSLGLSLALHEIDSRFAPGAFVSVGTRSSQGHARIRPVHGFESRTFSCKAKRCRPYVPKIRA
jgi:hypothetical protein